MKIIENPDKFRNNVRAKLSQLVKNDNYALNLEKGVFNWTLKECTQRKVIKKWDNLYFVEIYVEHLRSVYINLKNNAKLMDMLTSEQVKAHEIAFMTHQEMNPDRWAALIDKKMKLDRNKYEINMEASTDTFTCRKCKSKKCTYTQAQTRSADEPMTTFVSCINCGNRWKC